MEVFISSFPITIPFMRVSCLMALARSSKPTTNNKLDNGQPCLIPHFIERKNLKRGHWLTCSWKYWNAKFETIVKNWGRNWTALGPSLGNAIRLYRRLCRSQGRQQFQADRSKHKLQISFCCLIAKHHIWLCRSKEPLPNLNNFLLYLKHIYQIENNAFTVKNKWKPLLPYMSLLTWVFKT